MSDAKNPLSALIQDDSAELDLELLTELLKSYIKLSKDGAISTLRPFHEKDNQQKILIMLLAYKAKAILFDDETEGVAPSVLISAQIMAEGSVKSTLKHLLEKTREIKKDAKGGYYIPAYLLPDVEKRLEGGV